MFTAWRRRLRWLLGRGWSAADFAERYAKAGDVWGYGDSPQHRLRAEWILAALPQRRYTRALEAGCAQGFLTRSLATRVDRLVACDLSREAIAQAQDACRDLPNVELRVADIRRGFPGENYDLCLFSDVLYYLSPREIDAVLDAAARKTAIGGVLMIANEWASPARGLTPPDHAIARLDASPDWAPLERLRRPFGDGELTVALFRREGADETKIPRQA